MILGEGSRGQTRGAQQLGLDLHAASRKVKGKELSVLFPPGRPCAPEVIPSSVSDQLGPQAHPIFSEPHHPLGKDVQTA